MLRLHRALPSPLDFWASSHQAEVDAARCRKCGTCPTWCQVDAIAAEPGKMVAAIDPNRCIGCGLCAVHCPAGAISLIRRRETLPPPIDREALLEAINENKPGPLGRLRIAGKLVLDVMRTGNADILK